MVKIFVISYLIFIQLAFSQDRLRAAIVDVPPFGYSEKNEPKGINFDILADISKKSGVPFQYQVLPHTRLINYLSLDSPDITITFDKYCASNSEFYDILGTVYFAKPTLYLKKDVSVDKKDLKIGMIRNTCKEISEGLLKGKEIIELINMNQAFKMMSYGRLDGVCGLSPVVTYGQEANKALKIELKLHYTETGSLRAVVCRKKSLPSEVKIKIDKAISEMRNQVNY